MKIKNRYDYFKQIKFRLDQYIYTFEFDEMKAFISDTAMQFFSQRLDGGQIKNKEGEVLTRENIEPYLYEFTKGFDNGTKNFDLDIKKNNTLLNFSNEFLIDRIIGKLEGVRYPKELTAKEAQDFYLFETGINSTYRNPNKPEQNYITLKFMFDCGLYSGKKFRALQIINDNDADLIGKEIDKIFQQKTPAPETKREKLFDSVIDETKYNATKIFKRCIQMDIFKCEESTFIAWLVSGTGNHKKIKWVFKGGNKAQLRSFMNTITGREVEPAQINMAFENQIDSNNHPSKKLDKKLSSILTFSSLSNK